MRGVNRTIFIGRALSSNSTAVATLHRQPRVAPYATTCLSPNPRKIFHPLGLSSPFVSRSVTGFTYTSSAATSLAQDHHAKGSEVGFKPKQVVLFQYEACPFCNKVKAFLDYYDVPYKIVEVNPINKKEIKWSEYKKVPIVTVDGEQMVDSSDIIDKLIKRIRPDYDLNADEEKKWREWVDNHLVHILSPNIYRTVPEALESFEYITTHGNFTLSERLVAKYGGAAAMYFVSKKLRKKHNISDERAALYGAAEQWVDALKGRKFLGGSDPNLADLAVFGVLRPIRHLKSGRDMVEHTRIGKWFCDMEGAIGPSSRASEHSYNE
ncbi:prostaglandin E synthase 2-like [Abrus precatorius]|uniref:Prostaglandin E synthase 2 n=1 Tax=Abrus precatorius TaxID=3816 RepID=A0A8B8LFW3_ABRPR|nr:prostaglandin E synthase 2-like [Abrus precatorius]